MFTVGLTGGIGSGKSIVSDMFAGLGAGIVDTDEIAHKLVLPDTPCFDKLVEHFGKEAVSPDGSLNRRHVREIIFKNPAEKKWLEDLLHPLIREEALHEIAALTTPYCIVVIPLLTETYTEGSYNYLNRILVVNCEAEQQIKRAMARDHLSRQAAEAIVATQASQEARLEIANDVITNDQDLEHIRNQVEALHAQYLKML